MVYTKSYIKAYNCFCEALPYLFMHDELELSDVFMKFFTHPHKEEMLPENQNYATNALCALISIHDQ